MEPGLEVPAGAHAAHAVLLGPVHEVGDDGHQSSGVTIFHKAMYALA